MSLARPFHDFWRRDRILVDSQNRDGSNSTRRTRVIRALIWAWVLYIAHWLIPYVTSRQSIRARTRRQLFFLDESTAASIDSEVYEQVLAKSFSELSSPQGFLTGKPHTEEEFENLRDEIRRLAKESSLEFGSGKLQDLLLILFEVGFSISETVENLKGYTLDDKDLQRFVVDLFDVFQRHAPNAETVVLSTEEPQKEAIPQLSASATPNRSSKSDPSLENRYQNQSPISSEQSGENEEDAGQEILFQLTQEALNELIDPFLKPREDLWLEARTTKAKRKSHSKAICQAVDDPISIFRWLKSFLKHIQITPDYPPQTEHWAQAVRSEAANFREFLKLTEESIFNSLTSQSCEKCSKKAHIGMFCGHCGTGSAVAQKLFTSRPTTEICKSCSTDGLIRHFDNDYDICHECLSPAARRAKDAQWLWEVLSGDTDRAKLEQTRRRTRRLEERRHFAEQLRLAQQAGQDGTETQVPPPDANGQEVGNMPGEEIEIPSPELSVGDTSPSAGDSANPATPFGGAHDVPSLNIAGNESRDASQSPSQITSLEESVRAFDEQDISQESKISQKPLQELLDEAGFSVRREAGAHSSSTTEDIPSQHPPRSSSLPDASHSYPVSDAHLYTDPTLPQNRPSLGPQIPGCPSNEPTKSEPPDAATLRFWAALTILEAEDEQVRGGPGRLSEQEFLDIMLGDRGKGLEFVGDWMNLTAF